MNSSVAPGPHDHAPGTQAQNSDALLSEIEKRRDELDQLFRTAAHDLRAPLRSIEAFTRYAMETDERAETEELLGRALGAVDRMRSLLDSLLAYADAGGRHLDLETVPLAEVVQSAVADLEAELGESGATVECGDLPEVRCDPAQLQRVFTNVFTNSIRHASEPNRTIVVEATGDGAVVTVTVSDDGDGFDETLTDQVFEPFRRFSPASSGQGIGLAICRRIVEHHGGQMSASSSSGHGTTISFTLVQPGDGE